ncbi:unnamed protein product, partial [Porites evermanni]
MTPQPSTTLLASPLQQTSSVYPLVHGNWNSWSSWPNCNKPCNGGSKTRKRLCNNPEPANGGRDCEGSATESQSCNPNPCQADNINCKIRFPTKAWKETMANHSSKSYVECANETEGMVNVVIIKLFVTED